MLVFNKSWHFCLNILICNNLPDPFRIGTMLRAAPLTTRRKSLLRPTYLAYFYTIHEETKWVFVKRIMLGACNSKLPDSQDIDKVIGYQFNRKLSLEQEISQNFDHWERFTWLTGASLSRKTASWLSISSPNSVFRRSPEFPTTAQVRNCRGWKGGFAGNNTSRCSSQRVLL